MSTVLELERLRALIEQLVPLTSVERGDVIRASDWNVVVGTLVELARAVTSIETDREVPGHEHTGDVSLDWLDPELRQLVERGPLDDPIAVTRVIQIEQLARKLQGSIESISTETRGLREKLDVAVTRDLVRENSVVRVTQKVDGIADARNDVLALRRTLDTINSSIEGAITLRRELEVDGRLFDARSVSDRLSALDEMRDRMRLANGELLDAITIEQRLAETENRFVTRTDLEEILKNRGTRLSAEDLQGITTDLRLQLGSDIEGVRKQFEQKLSTELNARFSDIDALVGKSVQGNLPALRESLAASLRAELTAVVEVSAGTLQRDFDSRIASLAREIDLSIERDISTLATRFDADLDTLRGDVVPRKEIDTIVGEGTARVEKDLSAAIGKTIEQRLSQEIAASEKRTAAKIEDVEKRNTAVRTTDRAETFKAIDQRVAEEVAALEQKNLEATRTLVATEVAAEIKRLDADLQSRIQSAVKRSLDTELPELVSTAVNSRIRDLEKGLNNMIRDEVKLQLRDGGRGGTIKPVITGEVEVEEDFTRITGIGTVLATRLRNEGITTYSQLAALSPSEVATMLSKSETDAAEILREAKKLSSAGPRRGGG